MSGLESEFLFEMKGALAAPVDVGQTPIGQRSIFYVTGGTVEGPRFNGKMLPGGGDWALMRGDAILALDVRIALEANDGTHVYVTYGGRIAIPPEKMPLVFDPATADSVDPASYYFRTNPLFEAPVNSAYAWLNRTVAVGVGRFTAGGVAYRVHAIK